MIPAASRPQALCLALILGTAQLAACSSSTTDESSSGGQSSSGTSGGTPVDDKTSSAQDCFAACQNTKYACKVAGRTVSTVHLNPTDKGCTGGMERDGVQTLLDVRCEGTGEQAASQVCAGSDCAKGTFSAFAFSYKGSPGASSYECAAVAP